MYLERLLSLQSLSRMRAPQEEETDSRGVTFCVSGNKEDVQALVSSVFGDKVLEYGVEDSLPSIPNTFILIFSVYKQKENSYGTV